MTKPIKTGLCAESDELKQIPPSWTRYVWTELSMPQISSFRFKFNVIQNTARPT